MKRTSLRWTVVALAASAVLGVTGTAGAAKSKDTVLTVAHGPVTPSNSQLVDTAPVGPSVGDLRSYYIPLTRAGGSTAIGTLNGTLTTLWVDAPSAGMEIRSSNLIFVVGAAANQIVLGGIGTYPQSAPTVPQQSTLVRPVLGGSGRYAGARGWCLTTHYANNTWTHTFHLTFR